MNKKVLYFVTKSNWGGAQKYVLDLASFFQKEKGYDAVVSFGGNEFETKNIFEEKLNREKIPVIKIPGLVKNVGIWRDMRAFFQIMKIIRKEKPEIIHLNSGKMGIMGSVAARLVFSRAKIVFTAHGLSFLEDRSFMWRFLVKVLTYFTFLFSDQNILLSDKELKIVKNWPFVKKKVVRVYNGISPIKQKTKEEVKDEFYLKYGPEINQDVLFLGNISELTKNKGLSDTLGALEILDKKGQLFKYLHWGTGELEIELKNEVKERGLSDKVHFLGFDPEAKNNLKILDIFLFSSLKEGLPYTILEAGLSKVPIISTKVGAVPEIIKDRETGMLVERGDREGLAKALEELIKDKKKRENFANKNHKNTTKNFSLEQMLENTKKVYNL